MRMKLRTKLIFLVAVALIGIVGITLLASANLYSISSELISSLYYQSNVNSSLVLNADRDLHQALLAHHYLVSEPPDSHLYKDMQKYFTENTEQAQDRLHRAEYNLKSVPNLYTLRIDSDNGPTLKQEFDKFWIEYKIWYEDAVRLQNLHRKGAVFNIAVASDANYRKFLTARRKCDVIGETLDRFAKEQAQINWDKQNQTRRYLQIFGLIIILVLFVAGYYFIKDILYSVNKAGALIQQAAQGDVDQKEAEVLFKRRDEIGLIGKAFNAVMLNHTEEIRSSHMEMIYRLSQLGEFHDMETAQHVRRVGLYSELLGQLAGAPDDLVKLLFIITSLHDIGKAGVPTTILTKEGPLDDHEWEIMKQHTLIGGKVLEGGKSALIQNALDVALYHHERWDGKGYPMGLSGTNIPLSARICTISDSFDAMTSQRPYKKPLTIEQAIEEIKRNCGTQFDPELAEIFVHNIDRFAAIKDSIK